MRFLRPPILKIAFAAAYSLVAAELYLRFIAPVSLFPRCVVATSYGIRGNEPNRVYYHISPECYVRMETNSKGIRTDREIPYKKPPGVKRIVALGDSFGMGYEVNQDEMFLSRMEQALNRAGIPTEVVNLSVSGHSNAEELIALRAEGFKYEPDLVLVCWHPTDLEDNVRSSLYRLDGDRLVRAQPTYLPGTKVQETLASYRAYRWASENSHLYSFLREDIASKSKDFLVRLRGGAAAQRGKQTAEAEQEPGTQDAPKAGPPAPDHRRIAEPAPLGPKQKLCLMLLREIQAESEAHGARILVLDIPCFEWMNSQLWSLLTFDRELKSSGVPVVRPLERFLRVPDDELLFRRQGYHHLSPLGCRIVGEMLTETILRDRLLGPESAPRDRARDSSAPSTALSRP